MATDRGGDGGGDARGSGRGRATAALARDAQAFATLLMELLAVVPWPTLVGAAVPPVWFLGGVAAFGLWATRRLTERPLGGLRLADRQLLVVALAVLTALVAAKLLALPDYAVYDPGWLGAVVGSVGRLLNGPDAVVVTLVAVLAVWWRAVALVRADAELGEVEAAPDAGTAVGRDDLWSVMAPPLLLRFQLGVVSLGLAAALGAALGRADAGAVAGMLGFFMAGLLAIASGRARAAAAGGRPLGGQWLGVLLAVLGGLLLVGLIVGLIVASDAVRPLLAPVEWALRLIQLALGLVALVMGYIAQAVILFIRGLIGNREPQEQPVQEQGPPPDDLRDLLQRGDPAGLPPEVQTAIYWLSIAILVAITLRTIALAVQQRRPRTSDAEESRETLATGDELLALLRRAVLDLFRRLFGRSRVEPGAGTAIAGDLAITGDIPATARSIRQVYRDLLSWADIRGWGRLPPQTPREFERTLDDHTPAGAAELDALTRLYERARYGATAPAAEEAERAETMLARVKAGAERRS